jgi:hypothetical protein
VLPSCLVVAFRRDRKLPHAALLIFAMLWTTILAGGWFHILEDHRAPGTAFLALATAPFGACVADLPFTAAPRSSDWRSRWR